MVNEPAPPDDILRALANIHRLRILRALGDGALRVSDPQAHLPLPRSALSQHLTRLRDAEIAYRIVDDGALTLARALLKVGERQGEQRP